MLSAIATARSLAAAIGEPQLIRSLEALRQTSHDLGMDGQRSPIGDSYAQLGLPLAYVWDDHSTRFRDVLARILTMADASKSDDLIDACREVQKRFLVMSDRVAYIEVVCRQKLQWT